MRFYHLVSVIIAIFISFAVVFSQNESETDCRSEHIAFVSERTLKIDIYLFDLSDKSLQRLTDFNHSNYDPQFSSDGSNLIFVSDQSVTFVADLYLLEISSGNLTHLSATSDILEAYPTWSPDGGHIAYISNFDGDNELYIADLDNLENSIQVTHNDATELHPTWSPDGSQIAFVSDIDGDFEIYLVNVGDLEQVIQITDNDIWDSDPAWSPDSSRIAFVSGEQWQFDIFTMNRDGSDIEQLTDTEHNDTQLAWSPDGNRIAFGSDRTGNYEIYILDIETGDIQQLTDDSHFDGYPVWEPAMCILDDAETTRNDDQ